MPFLTTARRHEMNCVIRASLAAVLLVLAGCTSIERLAIPESRLLDPTHAYSGTEDDVDHSAWSNFLGR